MVSSLLLYSTLRATEDISQMNKLILTLPKPLNAMYGVSKSGHFYKKQEAKNWTQKCGWSIKKDIPKEPLEGHLRVSINMFLKFDRDIDSSLKASLDLLQEMGFYKNDSQIIHLTVAKFSTKDDPRLEIDIIKV